MVANSVQSQALCQDSGLVREILSFQEILTDRELREVSKFIVAVERVRLNGVNKDRREWVLETSCLFTAKSLFCSLIAEPSAPRLLSLTTFGKLVSLVKFKYLAGPY